ncbi:Class II Aminoacyl-tRNA synthetase/Biotinyl protein ligase (BPL) and lipoyl protein ligase (LPL) [Colletotrichum destructivum]|uniref:aspartate--tRNA ligase n=1 Tax=Colletotrichum destructivum TaxID=34406 RepID=A0AAX4J189_9PEZI|nr:Class II Aminoacyl-tRNA synthetase/Biotinyl protein ligase (BPL) and lipoyl protein ligase (LPL) [Colletotrichum destructivum]
MAPFITASGDDNYDTAVKARLDQKIAPRVSIEELTHNDGLTQLSALGEVVLGHIATFDARIHSVNVTDTTDDVQVLLRDGGLFAFGSIKLKDADDETAEAAHSLTAESLVRVSGPVIAHQKTHGRDAITASVEINKLKIISAAKKGLAKGLVSHRAPGDGSEQRESGLNGISLNDRLDNRVLDVRVASTASIFKIFSGVHELAVEYLSGRGFHWTPTPSLINYKIPGDDDYFSVPYFAGKDAWLTQTGEVHLGMALSADLDRIYDVHPVFRRERNVSTRHLTEFISLEVAFIVKHDWEEILELTESTILFIIHNLQERQKYKSELDVARRLYPSAGGFRLGLDAKGRLIRITFKEAKRILREKIGRQTDDQEDFSREEEAALGHYFAGDDSGLGPATDLFVITHYPRHLRPYNFFPAAGDESATNSFDIIMRGQEACTGLQLIHAHAELRRAMLARDPPIDPDSDMWRPFVEAYEAGAPPQGGFGSK